ncbi:MAG: acetyl-CoA carboxylase biotin carboxyl carrier protein subunit [Flavobacteriales bacterium]|nr:acetyl-CoA carboxylase biotin carboxyl carrier protein subunit [Flavobacteriales bacterium]
MKATLQDGKVFQIEIDGDHGQVDGQKFHLDLVLTGQDRYHLIHNDRSYDVIFTGVDLQKKEVSLTLNGKPFTVSLTDKYDALLAELGMENLNASQDKSIKAPMPGLVLDVNVKVGQEVDSNDPILILEAMKMENVIKSPGPGTVSQIHVSKGETVDKNFVLIEFE